MQSSKVVICLLLASFTLADINSDYNKFLNGEAELSQIHIDRMYSQFLHEYKDSQGLTPSSKFAYTNANRKLLFAYKVREIAEFNKNSSNSYKKGINAYSDMTDEEFNNYFNIVAAPQECSATNKTTLASLESLSVTPSTWDWRDQGVVTPVKNQASCGSCWTFSTVGCLESHYMMKYGQFRNLSEQQLVDCAGAFDNHGCHGGLPSHAFEYIKYTGGISQESDYPYMAKDQNCSIKSGSQVVGVVGGAVNISESEDDLKVALYQKGPISIAFEVINGFRDYKTGVYTTQNCKNGPQDVNHAVLAVGYGNENGMDYWVIKNSWGAWWGDNGYFKMQRGNNMCGIVNCNSYPQDVVDLTSQFNVFLQ